MTHARNGLHIVSFKEDKAWPRDRVWDCLLDRNDHYAFQRITDISNLLSVHWSFDIHLWRSFSRSCIYLRKGIHSKGIEHFLFYFFTILYNLSQFIRNEKKSKYLNITLLSLGMWFSFEINTELLFLPNISWPIYQISQCQGT